MKRSALQEIEVILNAALHKSRGDTNMVYWIENCVPAVAEFNLPEGREKLIDFIAKDNGKSLKQRVGVGTTTYQDILIYLLPN